jgi:hypothetical protein
MKAPKHFDTFVKKLFLFGDNGIGLNQSYIDKIAKNKTGDGLVCVVVTCLTIQAFKEIYEEEISDQTKFRCRGRGLMDDIYAPGTEFLITVARCPGHDRNYIVSFPLLRDYADGLRIKEEEKHKTRNNVKCPVVKDGKISSRFEIMDFGD